MLSYVISYQPYGVGKWTTATVSKDIAQALLKEYTSYGWPVSVERAVCTEAKVA